MRLNITKKKARTVVLQHLEERCLLAEGASTLQSPGVALIRADTDQNGTLSLTDLLDVVTALRNETSSPALDADGNGLLTINDVLAVVVQLRVRGPGQITAAEVANEASDALSTEHRTLIQNYFAKFMTERPTPGWAPEWIVQSLDDLIIALEGSRHADLSTDATVILLNRAGELQRWHRGYVDAINEGVVDFKLAPDRSPWFLDDARALHRWHDGVDEVMRPERITWFDFAQDDSLYLFRDNGELLWSSVSNTAQVERVIDEPLTGFLIAQNGRAYAWGADRRLYTSPNGTPGTFALLNGEPCVLFLAPDGVVYVLEDGGQLWRSPTGEPGTLTSP